MVVISGWSPLPIATFFSSQKKASRPLCPVSILDVNAFTHKQGEMIIRGERPMKGTQEREREQRKEERKEAYLY